MIAFPNAKINIGLNVISRRADDYHEIETLLYPLPIWDALEIVPASEFNFNVEGVSMPGSLQDNICVSAVKLLWARFPEVNKVKMILYKAIPMGAGLGGGSADGAHTLKLLNELFQLGLDKASLESMALELGSDCPFFIQNQPVLASGRGEQLRSVELDLSAYHLVLIYPGKGLNTKQAYKAIEPSAWQKNLKDIIDKPPPDWRTLLVNDFEAQAVDQIPQIAKIKEDLYDLGAVYASMTGSGSAVYGLFEAAPVGQAISARFKEGLIFQGLMNSDRKH